MSTQAKEKCPLCLETMDLTDKQLKPCKCGYEICLWCWHHIMEMDQKDECGGRCPGCRSFYNKDRILGTGISNQILKELCPDKSNLQKEQTKSQKQKSAKSQLRVAEEPIDPNNARVIQRKLVYIVGMPSEFAKDKVLRQKNFLGQYGKIENIIIDNIGANQQIPDSGRVYVTFSREEEAVRCIEAVNGYILDGRLLKATFGVTRYCHAWLSNKVCRKPNCSYVHQKAPAEDICTKDDVTVVCARLQHLLGMDMKDLQQRSGSTLPSPGDCNSRATICSGNSKDKEPPLLFKVKKNSGLVWHGLPVHHCINRESLHMKTCINDDRVLPNVGNKNPGTLPAATPWDSSVSSGNSSSIVNATLHRQNNHESILDTQQNFSASKYQELQPLGPKEQLASNDDKSQASAQLGNGISNSEQMTSEGNETVDSSLRKQQYVNVVSQGSSGSGRRFTVLTRQVASTNTRSKATGQVGSVISNSKKITLAKTEHSDSITIPRCQNVKVVSQTPEGPSHKLTNQLASSIVKSHAGAEDKNACSDISDKPVQGKHMQLLESTGLHSSTALQSLGASPMLSNLPTSNVKSQISVGPDKLSDSHRKLSSENQSQLLNQQKVAVSITDIASASDCRSTLNNQVLPTDGKHQTSAQGGDHSLYSMEMTLSGDQVSSQHAESVLLPRPVSVISSTDIAAKDSKGRKRQVCPPGFKELHHSSDSGKFVSVSSSTCSALCSTSDALVQDSCSITDQPDIISWVSECLEDDGDTKQSNSVSISSTHSSADTIWRCTQYPGSVFSGASNQLLVSPYSSGYLQCMGGVENTRCCRAFSPISSTPNQKPEYWNGSANSYMSIGGYDAFCQNSTSGMKAGMVGTLLQQPSPPSLYNDWTNGNADSGFKSSQVDLSYPMYSLFG